MRSNKLVFAGILVLVVAAGVISFLTFGKKQPENESSGPKEEASKEKQLTGSIKDLIFGGESQKCIYKTGDNSGTVYVTSEGKVRGDFTSETEGAVTNSHVIIDGKTSYYWSDGQTKGFKVVSTDNESENSDYSNLQPSGYSAADLSGNYSYTCYPWLTDSSVFTPPTTINFQSLEDLYSGTLPQYSTINTEE